MAPTTTTVPVLSPDLIDRCREQGVQLYSLPVTPARGHALLDGKACLVFSSSPERQRRIQVCNLEVNQRCLQGARAGCALRAIDQCRGPAPVRWLNSILQRRQDWSAIEACETECTQACASNAEAGCRQHAGTFCAASHPPALCDDDSLDQ